MIDFLLNFFQLASEFCTAYLSVLATGQNDLRLRNEAEFVGGGGVFSEEARRTCLVEPHRQAAIVEGGETNIPVPRSRHDFPVRRIRQKLGLENVLTMT